MMSVNSAKVRGEEGAEEEEGREQILVQEGIRAGIARWEEEMTVEVVVLVVEEE